MSHTVEQMDRITVNPQQCGGHPCVRGMRIRVMDVSDLLAAGLSPEQILALPRPVSQTLARPST